MASQAHIGALAIATPAHRFAQHTILELVREQVLGRDWRDHPEHSREAHAIEHLFTASGVEQRNSVVDLTTYYQHPHSTAERMRDYQRCAYDLGRSAVSRCIADAARAAGTDVETATRAVTDFVVVSCTGYAAPGLDVLLARDLGVPPQVRRLSVGHMGCFGAMVGLRQALTTLRADPSATVLVLTVELTTLHFMPTHDMEAITSFALFGDAAAAVYVHGDRLPSNTAEAHAPRDAVRAPSQPAASIIDCQSLAAFDAADQMSWTITDQGFVMGLSPRVPVTLRRHVREALDSLLAPHGLSAADVRHWVVHPGGPSILRAVQQKLELTDEQVALSWEVLRHEGNCSSCTVLMVLDRLLRAPSVSPGDWCVMMAFGPGLTLELSLLRL